MKWLVAIVGAYVALQGVTAPGLRYRTWVDMDCDGRADRISVYKRHETALVVLEEMGLLGFRPPKILYEGSPADIMVIDDFDYDGDLDIELERIETYRGFGFRGNYISRVQLLNDGHGNFRAPKELVPLPEHVRDGMKGKKKIA